MLNPRSRHMPWLCSCELGPSKLRTCSEGQVNVDVRGKAAFRHVP